MIPNQLQNSKSLAQNDTISLLRARIQDGRYSFGEKLPAERDLANNFKVHRRVIREAIAQLEQEGLLARRPNCRPIVQEAPRTVTGKSELVFPYIRLVAFVMFHQESPSRTDFAQQRLFWGLNQTLGHAGYHGVFLDLGNNNINTNEEKSAFEAHHLQYALDNGFAGVIFYPYSYNKSRDIIREVARQTPLVLIDRMASGVDADYVGMQNHDSILNAANYLIKLGHKRIAYVTTTDPISPVQDRLQGYLSALRTSFKQPFYEMILPLPIPGNSWPLFDAAFSESAGKRPTALICVNDYEAVNVYSRLQKIGLRVPEDVSLIGCDNVVELLPNGKGLTTIEQPFEDIGREAAKLFLRRIENPASHADYIELPANLIIRESSSAP
jgi:DNA-binding LacI/PurR family transcriptional regulator